MEYLVTDSDRFHLFVPNEYAHLVDVNDFSSLHILPLVAEARSAGPYLLKQMLAICQSRGFDCNNVIACDDFASVIAFTNAGMGFTIFPLAVSRSVNTDHIVSFSIPGEDALTTNAVGWDPCSGNNTAEAFLATIQELYPFTPPEKICYDTV